MKVLLTHGYFLADDEKEKRIMRPYPPLGVLYISSYLEKYGFPNEIFDTTFSSNEKLHQYISSFRPDIIGIYTNLVTKINVVRIIGFIKQILPQAHIVVGGPDVKYNAENYLRSGAHFVISGEGEQTMLELLQYLKHRDRSISSIHSLSYWDNGVFTRNIDRSDKLDIDKLPYPNRRKIDLQPYLDIWKQHHGQNALSISTMRGCPYTCKWCSRAVYGLSYRRRSASLVAEELENIVKEYSPDTLWFVDDVFTISHQWLEKFVAELEKRQLKISYECITRADRMNEHVVQLLKQSGCFRVWIGAESGSQKVIDLMDRRVEVGRVREMIQLTRRNGIEAGTFIMLGYPGESEDDIFETVEHLKSSNPDHFTITVAYPIKGTELWNEVGTETDYDKWSISTDRQAEFRRTYSRRYYDYAVKHVVNEVNFSKAFERRQVASAKFKVKALLARTGMWWESRKG